MTVEILCGPSGIGKSTYAATALTPGRDVFSADHWFERLAERNGLSYKDVFEPRLLGKAHQACFREFIRAILNCTDPSCVHLRVDNTNTTVGELSPYVLAAEAYGHEVEVTIFLPEEDLETERAAKFLAARNDHGVPESVIVQQLERLHRLISEWPPYWPEPEIRRVALRDPTDAIEKE